MSSNQEPFYCVICKRLVTNDRSILCDDCIIAQMEAGEEEEEEEVEDLSEAWCPICGDMYWAIGNCPNCG